MQLYQKRKKTREITQCNGTALHTTAAAAINTIASAEHRERACGSRFAQKNYNTRKNGAANGGTRAAAQAVTVTTAAAAVECE